MPGGNNSVKKQLLSILLITIVFALFAQMPAYALDTTTVTIDGKTNFTVSLKSNSLVFSNQFTDSEYESIKITIHNSQTEVFSKIMI